MVDDTIMIYILVESISGSYGSCSIPHNNRIAGNIFHHVAIGITCIRGIFTWTKYTGQDPEVKTENTYARDSATTPASIQLVAGFNLSF